MYLWDIENRSTYNNRMGQNKTQSELNFLRKYFDSPKNVLDIGGGSGRFAIPLNSEGHKITVIDRDKEALGLLSGRCSTIKFINEDFMKWNSPAKKEYDIILSIEVLLYIDDWSTFFKKVHTLLKDDGIFIFTATNKYSWRTIFQRLKDFNKSDYHYSIFSLNEYKKIIRESSFKVEKVAGFLWIPCKIDSNSKLVNIFARIEKQFSLNRFISQSPWLIFALQKSSKSID